MSQVINDTELFEQLVSHAIPDVIVNVVTFVAVTAVLFVLNWKLALMSTIPIPLVVFSLRVYARHVRPAFRNRQRELGDLNAVLNDNLSGIREIKAFTREPHEAKRVHQQIDNYRQSLLRAAAADGDVPAVREFHILAWHADRDLLRRQAGAAGAPESTGACGVLHVPGHVLRSGAEP